MKNTYLLVILLLLIAGTGIYFKFIRNDNNEQLPNLRPHINLTQQKSKNMVHLAPTPTVSNGYQDGIALTIESPKNNSVTNQSKIVISGKTSPFAEVFVNDQKLAADSKGIFVTSVELDEGENLIIIDVNDAKGNNAEETLSVNY